MGQQSSQIAPTPAVGAQPSQDTAMSPEAAPTPELNGDPDQDSTASEIEARPNPKKTGPSPIRPSFVNRENSPKALKGKEEKKKVKKSKSGEKKNKKKERRSAASEVNEDAMPVSEEPMVADSQPDLASPKKSLQATQDQVEGDEKDIKKVKKVKMSKKFKGRPSAVQIFPSQEANEQPLQAGAEETRVEDGVEVDGKEAGEAQAQRPKKRRRQMAFGSPGVSVTNAPASAEPQQVHEDVPSGKPKKRRRKVSFQSPKQKEEHGALEIDDDQNDDADAMDVDDSMDKQAHHETEKSIEPEDRQSRKVSEEEHASKDESPNRTVPAPRIPPANSPTLDVPEKGSPNPPKTVAERRAMAVADRRAAAERMGVNYEEALAEYNRIRGIEDPKEKKKKPKKKTKPKGEQSKDVQSKESRSKDPPSKDTQTKSMPTPPESEQPPAPEDETKKDLNAVVKQWLESQQTPNPGMEMAGNASDHMAETEESKKRRKQRKRKRAQLAVNGADEDGDAQKVQSGDDDEPEYVPGSVSESVDRIEGEFDAESEPDAKRKKKRSKKSSTTKVQAAKASPGGNPGFQSSGMFTKEEKAVVEQTVVDYLEDTGTTRGDLEVAVIDWQNMDPNFKNAMFEALPLRSKASLRKHCQTRYLPSEMSRGKWNDKDDAELRRLYSEMPGNWVEIGDMMNRGALACRGRWNTIEHSDVRETGPWSAEDEDLLVELVERYCDVVRKDSDDADAIANPDKYVNWTAIVEQMGHRRDTKRAREKWKQLKDRRANKANGYNLQSMHQLSTAGKKPNEMSNKLRRVEKKFNSLQCGDFYDALMEVHRAMDNDTKQYAEESTFWSVVSLRNKGSRFPGPLRRRAFYDCLEKYADGEATAPSAKLAKMLARKMEKLHGEEQVRACYGLEPEKAKAARDQLAAEFSATQTAPAWDNEARPLKSKGKPLSGEYVLQKDLDEEAGDEEAEDGGVAGLEQPGVEVEPQPEPEPEPEPEVEVLDELPLSSIDDNYDGYMAARPSPTLGPCRFLARLSGGR